MQIKYKDDVYFCYYLKDLERFYQIIRAMIIAKDFMAKIPYPNEPNYAARFCREMNNFNYEAIFD